MRNAQILHNIYKHTSIILSLVLALLFCIPSSTVLALSKEQKDVFRSGIYYFDVADDQAAAGCAISKDGNPFHVLAFPPITNDATAAAAINSYITEKSSTSPFKSLGNEFIAGARRYNVNPFLAVAHIQHESGFGVAGSNGWHNNVYATEDAARRQDKAQKTDSNNAFGRSAGDGQPAAYYLRGSGEVRAVYKWGTWAESLDDGGSDDEWYALIRREYLAPDGRRKIDPGDFATYVHTYAPKSDGNNEEVYIASLFDTIDALVAITNGAPASSAGSESAQVSSACGGASDQAASIIQTALAEVGNKEDPAGSNRGPTINKYFEEQGFSPGNTWCEIFTQWVIFKATGTKIGVYGAKNTGAWFRDNKNFWSWRDKIRPQPGDVVVKGREGSGATLNGGAGHIGIVVQVTGFSMKTVEGNSSDQVSQREYTDYREIEDLVGFGRFSDPGTVQTDPTFDPLAGYTGGSGGGGKED